jgi:predicted DsbA family dithiol-disulfide isomerase
MHLVELFILSGDRRSQQARMVFEEVLERTDDLVLITYDIEERAGQEKAAAMEIGEVPAAVIDRERAIIGVPESPDQVLSTLR